MLRPSHVGVGVGVDIGGDVVVAIVAIVASIGAQHVPASIWPGALHGHGCDNNGCCDQQGKCCAPTLTAIVGVVVAAILTHARPPIRMSITR
jgi:hypothetical protein